MSSKRYDDSRQWYAIHTYSGYEEKVAESIRQRINGVDMADKIFDVMVPKEKQIQIKNGKRKIIDVKIFQGYVLVEMKLTDETWYIIRNTPGVPDLSAPTLRQRQFLKKKLPRLKNAWASRSQSIKSTFQKAKLFQLLTGRSRALTAQLAKSTPLRVR